jgi:hypothetical protein
MNLFASRILAASQDVLCRGGGIEISKTVRPGPGAQPCARVAKMEVGVRRPR